MSSRVDASERSLLADMLRETDATSPRPPAGSASPAQIDVGVRALDRGDFDEIDGHDLERYLARLTPPRKQAR